MIRLPYLVEKSNYEILLKTHTICNSMPLDTTNIESYLSNLAKGIKLLSGEEMMVHENDPLHLVLEKASIRFTELCYDRGFTKVEMRNDGLNQVLMVMESDIEPSIYHVPVQAIEKDLDPLKKSLFRKLIRSIIQIIGGKILFHKDSSEMQYLQDSEDEDYLKIFEENKKNSVQKLAKCYSRPVVNHKKIKKICDQILRKEKQSSKLMSILQEGVHAYSVLQTENVDYYGDIYEIEEMFGQDQFFCICLDPDDPLTIAWIEDINERGSNADYISFFDRMFILNDYTTHIPYMVKPKGPDLILEFLSKLIIYVQERYHPEQS